MPGMARKLWTIGISGVAVLAIAGCGTSAASQHTTSKAPVAIPHIRGKLVSPPVDLSHATPTVVIHPRLVSPAAPLLPVSPPKLADHVVR